MFDLQCDNLTKMFGAFCAVNDVSLEVPSGSFFSILGPSGCGKTTLMRMIAGFETPSGGDIRIKGQSVLSIGPNKRNVKMVFQHLALFPMMDVGENIAYGLRCRGDSKSEIKTRVAAVLDRIGLAGYEGKRISQLSGGQKQRVAIARCMVLEPDVLLLDEPLGALDLKLREHMKIELKQLQHQFNTTFLYITHDQSEALVMSDNVAVMNAGRFEQIGAPEDLYRAPSSAFVAGFVGDSNRWSGTVTALDRDQVKVGLDGGATLVAPLAGGSSGQGGGSSNTGRLSVGDTASVFVRPEALVVTPGLLPDAPDRNRLQGTIDSFLFNGANSRVLVRTSRGELIEVDHRLDGGLSRESVGQDVTLEWPHAGGICFKAED
ncbi:ABC transporter ATP-binding protein [Hwanghaeella grinnelliae]|uniref:ABC transporter ATP-binding protein n=1 Tax=Hwanghaeella grinnelliae TaxID=2500179 RepID=A0A3S2ZCT7_9PROT|nr:ABC transporter ATP-binding protein [Hwanghaeella grinnelliae]RVU39557.1 ABC transporter ATP-binding protein [Hwanghaeella grinnelliae]